MCHQTDLEHERDILLQQIHTLWKSLPAHLRQTDVNYKRSRRLLKTFLFGSSDRNALRLTVKLLATKATLLTHRLTYLMASTVNNTHTSMIQWNYNKDTYTPRDMPCLSASRPALDVVLLRRCSTLLPAGLPDLDCTGGQSLERSFVRSLVAGTGRLTSLPRSLPGDRLVGLALPRPAARLSRLDLDAANSTLFGTTTLDR